MVFQIIQTALKVTAREPSGSRTPQPPSRTEAPKNTRPERSDGRGSSPAAWASAAAISRAVWKRNAGFRASARSKNTSISAPRVRSSREGGGADSPEQMGYFYVPDADPKDPPHHLMLIRIYEVENRVGLTTQVSLRLIS